VRSGIAADSRATISNHPLESLMYAVVVTGGKQYRVEAGSTLDVERLAGDAGASVTFDRVLMIGDGDQVTVGTPVVAGASVSGTVISQALGPKLIIFKFKQKVKYRRRTGHRQHLTRVRIDAINPTAPAAQEEPAKAVRPRTSRAKAPIVDTAPETAVAKPRARRKAPAKE
jgi:large subunit ribosomal protein L21